MSPAVTPSRPSSNPGGLPAAPISADTPSCFSGGLRLDLGPLRPGQPASREVHHDRVALFGAAVLDRLHLGQAVAQPRQRLVDVVLGDRHLGPLDRQGGQVARFHVRRRLDGRRERQRLAFLELQVAHLRRVHRLDVLVAQRVADDARHEVVRDVVQDLLAKPLAHHVRRRLAGPEARNAGLPGIALRDAGDFGVDHLGRHFHRQGLLGFADVGEFDLHRLRDSGLGTRESGKRRASVRASGVGNAGDGSCADAACLAGRSSRASDVWNAKGGTRTPMTFRPPDPKSGASASSATFAWRPPNTPRYHCERRLVNPARSLQSFPTHVRFGNSREALMSWAGNALKSFGVNGLTAWSTRPRSGWPCSCASSGHDQDAALDRWAPWRSRHPSGHSSRRPPPSRCGRRIARLQANRRRRCARPSPTLGDRAKRGSGDGESRKSGRAGSRHPDVEGLPADASAPRAASVCIRSKATTRR